MALRPLSRIEKPFARMGSFQGSCRAGLVLPGLRRGEAEREWRLCRHRASSRKGEPSRRRRRSSALPPSSPRKRQYLQPEGQVGLLSLQGRLPLSGLEVRADLGEHRHLLGLLIVLPGAKNEASAGFRFRPSARHFLRAAPCWATARSSHSPIHGHEAQRQKRPPTEKPTQGDKGCWFRRGNTGQSGGVETEGPCQGLPRWG